LADDGQDTRSGGRTGGDRRGNDRRRLERRSPPPLWRRPIAYASYGAAAVLLFFLLRGCGGDEQPPVAVAPVAPAPAPLSTTPTPRQAGPVEDAMKTADFERLTLEGERAVGRRVRTQLYCDAPTPVALQGTTDTVEAAIAPLVDSVTQRVPAAECLWGASDDPRREQFLLLVPRPLADEFAAQPVTLDGYVRRRRVLAEVEWIGKSRALALQTVGVLRGTRR
jgi:hypothetical protein